jgi:hypothetical protein
VVAPGLGIAAVASKLEGVVSGAALEAEAPTHHRNILGCSAGGNDRHPFCSRAQVTGEYLSLDVASRFNPGRYAAHHLAGSDEAGYLGLGPNSCRGPTGCGSWTAPVVARRQYVWGFLGAQKIDLAGRKLCVPLWSLGGVIGEAFKARHLPLSMPRNIERHQETENQQPI